MKLVLFDIDGTLITPAVRGAARCGPRWRDYGTAERIDGTTCRADRSRIVADLMGAGGIPPRRVKERIDAASTPTRSHSPGRSATAARSSPAGVAEVVGGSARTPEVVLGLVTGNTEEGARIKLAAHRALAHFRAGAYGSDHTDRRRLPGLATRRARALMGYAFAPTDVLVIGDTPHDIECARAFGAVAVAVTTGQYSRAELPRPGPTSVRHLGDVEATIRRCWTLRRDPRRGRCAGPDAAT